MGKGDGCANIPYGVYFVDINDRSLLKTSAGALHSRTKQSARARIPTDYDICRKDYLQLPPPTSVREKSDMT